MVTSPQDGYISSRSGTSQRPVRWTVPPRWSIRITSLTGTDSGARLTGATRSAVRRPSAVAARSTSMTRSRSASEALTSGAGKGSGGSPGGGKSADTCLRSARVLGLRGGSRQRANATSPAGRGTRAGEGRLTGLGVARATPPDTELLHELGGLIL